MRVQEIEITDVPKRGRISEKYGEKEEMINAILSSMSALLLTKDSVIIEIIDDAHVFNNNNDLRRQIQKTLENEGYDDILKVFMRRGSTFLADIDSYNQLLMKEFREGSNTRSNAIHENDEEYER